MSRPAWLPPLNSHEDYSINVGIQEGDYHPTLAVPENLKTIDIKVCVDVKFSSDDFNKREQSPAFVGLELSHRAQIFGSPRSRARVKKCLKMILRNRMFVPFTLDKIGCYRETDEVEHEVRTKRELFSRVTDFLMNCSSTCRNVKVVLSIEKSVTIPDQEFEAWTRWYEEQKRVDPDGFEEGYLAAIREPRTVDELWYESSLLSYESAADSCIESLEKMRLEEAVVGDSCCICLEELGKGEQVTKLACSHVFHGDCVIPWLKTSRFCPLCRSMLPK